VQDHFEGRTSVYECENRLRMKSGEYRWNLDRGKVVERDKNGAPLRMVGTDADITGRKQAEAALRESERHNREQAAELAAILDAAPTPIFIAHDPDCRHITGNRAADELLRNPYGTEASLSAPAETRPRHFKAFKDGRELRNEELPAERAARGLPVQNFEFSLVFDDGTTREVLGYGMPLWDDKGRPRGAVHVLVDITERKHAEEALRHSETRLTLAQEIAHVGDYEVNVGGTGGDYWSEESFRILGLDPATKELTPNGYVLRCVHPEDQARVREAFDRSRNERIRFDLEYRIVRPDGSIRHVHSIVEPVPGADDEAVKLVGTLQDITERKELEREILEISEREQSRIGQDLHDGLCQHLAGIEFRLLDLKQKLQGKTSRQAAETTELARLVREGIEQTRTLAHGLSPVMLRAEGLMTALQELAINTEQSFRISCSFNCPAPVLIHDNAVATHLYRIAQEAVQNAIRHGKAKFIVINLLTRNDRIVLGVKDDGVGFPKKPHRHDGMGLRIMQYRAGMVGGSLVVQHEPDGGTSIVCSLRADRGREETERVEGKRADE